MAAIRNIEGPLITWTYATVPSSSIFTQKSIAPGILAYIAIFGYTGATS